ncbi:LysR family transcriptional regulator [Microbacterium aurugineum]|uniref:LysR family transcriptional regulator n=1 Tax=Microbacterium TaxID=33882 RepID=UPI001E2C7DFD|nr:MULTISPECIES: LysR family transcriptional regulator [unclassified Microbacterium]MCE0508993.1 LysR family transcriptional regulator [Microbacterium sp. KKR3/1]UUE21246.1 LysR family transcriptional regulator [Microbacterium sp. J1-1]
MVMNLEQLRGFVEVARLGHFTRASEHLHLAQPSLSRQISTLERELGAELFHRARGHISLTAAGETLLPRAQRMLADADAIRDEMGELAGLRRGRVRLGAPPTLCISLVAEAVSSFHAAYPDVDLHLTESGSRLLVEQLAVGAVDIALITASDGLPPAGVSLTRMPLLAEELVVVSSAAEPPLTDGPAIDLEQLAGLPLITFGESYELRATTDAAFREAGLTPHPVLEGAEMDTALRFVERGLGVAVVPAMVLFDRPGLRSVRLSHPMMTRTVSLAHRSDVTPAIAVAAMRKAIVSTSAEVARRDPAITSLL